MATSLKKHLQSLTHDELVEEVLKLLKRFKKVSMCFARELANTYQEIKDLIFVKTVRYL